MKLSGALAAAMEAGIALQLVESAAVDQKRVRKLLDFWRPDACIVESGDDVRYCPASVFKGVPTVFIDRDPTSLPRSMTSVNVDSREVSAAAARELMSLGFSNFACLPVLKDVFWARERTAAFVEALNLNGRSCDVFDSSGDDMTTALPRWIATLPRPCGIFTATDRLGAVLLPAIRKAGASVPDDFAVVGVDNDETLCETSTPTLSSVLPDYRQCGRIAVETLLGRQSVGRKLFGVSRLVRRASSFRPSQRIRPAVSAVLDTIRLHACDGLTAAAAAAQMGVSRRLSERVFKDATGHTFLEAIHARRLERAAELVRNSSTPLEMIPGLVGWKSATAFRESFRAAFGATMREMRRTTRQRT